MDKLYTFRNWLAPLAGCLALLLTAETEAATTVAAVATPQTELAIDRGEKAAKSKEEIKKPQKRKKVKYRRTNHGPRRPLFPQDRRNMTLNRADYRNPYMHHRH